MVPRAILRYGLPGLILTVCPAAMYPALAEMWRGGKRRGGGGGGGGVSVNDIVTA